MTKKNQPFCNQKKNYMDQTLKINKIKIMHLKTRILRHNDIKSEPKNAKIVECVRKIELPKRD